MKDEDRTRTQLIEELGRLRGQVAALEAAETDRQQAEEALRESEERAQLLLDTVRLGIYECDNDGVILWVNAAAEKMSGHAKDRLIGTRVWDRMEPGPQKDSLAAYLEHLAREQPVPSPYLAEVGTKDGRSITIQVDWSYKRDKEGQVRGFVCVVSDITARKQAEKALRESEQRLSLHFQQTPLAAIEWDVAATVTKWNPGAVRVFGYTEAAALGRHVSFIVPPHVREHVDHLRDALLARTGGGRSTNENVTKDGRTILCEWYNTPLVDADGKVIGAASLAEDITEKNRAEEALRESEERFRQAMEATHDGLWDWNVETGDIYCSPAYSGMLGYAVAEFAEQIYTWTHLVHPDDLAEVLRLNHDCVENRLPGFEVEFRMRAKNGEWRTILGRGKAVRRDASGRALRVIGTHMDITVRKRAEEALQKAHDELEDKVRERTAELAVFQRFAEASGRGFGMTDLDGRITYANPTLCRLFGEERPEDVIGQHISAYNPEAYKQRREKEILPALSREGSWHGEQAILSRDGTLIPTLRNNFLIRDESGEPFLVGIAVADITQLKQAKEALRTSEEKCRTLVGTSPDGVIMADLQGRITFVSPKMLEMQGVEHDGEVLGRDSRDFIAAEDHEKFLAHYQKTLAEGVSAGVELVLVRKDGTRYPVEASAATITDADGKPTALMAVLRDITERKQTQVALQAATERYELAVRGAGVGIFDWNILTGKVYYSPRWKTLFGYEEDEIGDGVEDWARLLHPDERDSIIKRQDDFFAGTSPTATAEYRLRHKDGSYRWIMAHVLVVRDKKGRACRLVGSHGDITDRKRAEQALQTSEARFRSYFEQGLIGMAVSTPGRQWTQVNDRLCEILGYSRDELLRMKWTDLTHPDDLERNLALQDRVLAGERQYYTLDKRFIRKHGTVVDATVFVRCFRHPDGSLDHILALIEDISERKQAEEALAASEAKYRQLVETTGTGYLILDGQGRVVDANPEYLRLSGHRTLEDILGRSVVEWTAPYDVDHNAKEIEQCFREGFVRQLEIDYAHSDAKIVPVEINATCIETKDGRRIVSLCRDVTERKRAQEALRNSEERYRAVVEDQTEVISRFKADGTFTFVNEVFCRFFGKTSQELLGNKWQPVALAGDLPMIEEQLRAMSPDNRVVTVENRVYSGTGEVRWMQFVNRGFFDEEGQLTEVQAVGRDITERKQVEESLRRSEESLKQSERRFRNYFEQGLIGMAATSLDGRWLQVNERICEILGYSREDLFQTTWKELTYPEDLAKDIDQFNRVLAGELEHYTLDKRFVRKDGTIVYTTILIRAFRKEDGAIDHLVGLMEDITARKRAEEALRQSEARFRSYFEQGLIGMAVSSADNRWFQVNDRYCDMLGYSRDELLGMKWTDLTHPDDLERNFVPQNRLLAGEIEHYTIDKRFLRKDGSIMYATVFARCFRRQDGSVDHFLALVEDTTERKQAEEALAASEAKYRQLVETTGTGYLILDGQGRVVDANPEYLRISGHRTLEDIVGRRVVEWTAPCDVDRNAKEVEKCFENGYIRQLEIDYVHPDGRIAPVEINATCIDTEDGWRIVSLCRDISERKQAQEALDRERRSLWKMLQASDHERQIISYEIHDGLAQYLAAAGMQFQAHDSLREDSPGEAKKAYETAVELVRQAHFEARRLISEVRPPVIDETGLETAISHLVHEHRRDAGPKIKFDCDVQFSRLPQVLENALYRIVQEALTNACKHSKSKKVTVTMTQEERELRLDVRDWGIGFDPESVEKGHFGLEGIRQRVRLLGGRLTIESMPDSGTLIEVVVPILVPTWS